MKSQTLSLYKEWLAIANTEQIEFVDDVFALCEAHYEQGGDTVVECYSPKEILKEFSTLYDVKVLCGLKVEQELNYRWGEDTDPEMERSKRFQEWEN